MRVTHMINTNTLHEYQTSPEAAQLSDETNRGIRADNLGLEPSEVETLITICIKSIAKNFQKYPLFYELPHQDIDFLLELLSKDLPLELTIPLINDNSDDIYWHRCYNEKYGLIVECKRAKQSWKSIYLERYVRELCEEAQTQYNQEYNMNKILKLCAPYVQVLVVKQLLYWLPSRLTEPKDMPPIDRYLKHHINFIPILKMLPNIVKLDITFGMRNVGTDYTIRMFELTPEDCLNLGKAVNSLEFLTCLRLHRSRIGDKHIKQFARELTNNTSLLELDLSYCKINNLGTKCLAKMLTSLTQLKILNLKCNEIGADGANGIAYALVNCPDITLHQLDLTLNPLGLQGIMPICSALLRCSIPANLKISGCNIMGDTGAKVGGMLKHNSSLKELDITNNDFGELGGQAIMYSMQTNRTIMKIDMRRSGIPQQIQDDINKILKENVKLHMKEIQQKPSKLISLNSLESLEQHQIYSSNWKKVYFSEVY